MVFPSRKRGTIIHNADSVNTFRNMHSLKVARFTHCPTYCLGLQPTQQLFTSAKVCHKHFDPSMYAGHACGSSIRRSLQYDAVPIDARERREMHTDGQCHDDSLRQTSSSAAVDEDGNDENMETTYSELDETSSSASAFVPTASSSDDEDGNFVEREINSKYVIVDRELLRQLILR